MCSVGNVSTHHTSCFNTPYLSSVYLTFLFHLSFVLSSFLLPLSVCFCFIIFLIISLLLSFIHFFIYSLFFFIYSFFFFLFFTHPIFINISRRVLSRLESIWGLFSRLCSQCLTRLVILSVCSSIIALFYHYTLV